VVALCFMLTAIPYAAYAHMLWLNASNYAPKAGEPVSIEVGFGRAAFASLRTFDMQNMLHKNHLNGGPLAAPPGKTWHHRCAIDLGVRSEAGREAMIRHGFFDLLPQDPPHFTFGRRG